MINTQILIFVCSFIVGHTIKERSFKESFFVMLACLITMMSLYHITADMLCMKISCAQHVSMDHCTFVCVIVHKT